MFEMVMSPVTNYSVILTNLLIFQYHCHHLMRVSWAQMKIVIKLLFIEVNPNIQGDKSIDSFSSKLVAADNIIALFHGRRESTDYRNGDEEIYDIVMKSCGYLRKWELAIEFFDELLRERQKLSPFIFETVVEQLIQANIIQNDVNDGMRADLNPQNLKNSSSKNASDISTPILVKESLPIVSAYLSDIYQLMVRSKVSPTPKTEQILLTYLPNDLKSQLQRQIILKSDLSTATSTVSSKQKFNDISTISSSIKPPLVKG